MIFYNLKFKRLIKLLDQAEKLAGQFSGGYSNNFLSAEEFHTELAASIQKFKAGGIEQINHLWLWFAPSCDWDDFILKDGQDLANEIWSLLTELKNSSDVYSIIDLIIDYQENVDKVVSIFKHEFNREDLLTAWKSDRVYPQIGELKKHGIKQYSFHGIGLNVEFNDSTSVDFDFAFLPEQRHDGFDLWRLQEFASTKPEYKKYLEREKLEREFDELIDNGTILKPETIPSTTLYFFKSSLKNPRLSDIKIKKAWWKVWQ